MTETTAQLLLFFCLVCATAVGIVVISSLLGRRTLSPAKDVPYECGMLPLEKPEGAFPIRYYKIALLFVVFDIEIIFLYLWAVVVRDLGWFGLVEMVLFIAILMAAFVYAWRRGDLKWD